MTDLLGVDVSQPTYVTRQGTAGALADVWAEGPVLVRLGAIELPHLRLERVDRASWRGTPVVELAVHRDQRTLVLLVPDDLTVRVQSPPGSMVDSAGLPEVDGGPIRVGGKVATGPWRREQRR